MKTVRKSMYNKQHSVKDNTNLEHSIKDILGNDVRGYGQKQIYKLLECARNHPQFYACTYIHTWHAAAEASSYMD